MNRDLSLALRQNAVRRAHLYGAHAVVLEKEADKLAAQAQLARKRYFRELEAIDLLGGHESSFGGLG